MEKRLMSAEERRREIEARAGALGIDEAYIARLVDTFYGRIREDDVLGPIFEKVVAGRWEPHLRTMKSFWASVALNAGTYSGKPVPAHKKLDGLEPAHFQRWLGLFRQTLEDTAPTEGAIAYFMERAERIAASLQLALFSTPEKILEDARRRHAEREGQI